MLREALRLPPKARADVAGLLLLSLDGPVEHGLDDAWAREVTRRVADVDAARVTLVPWQRARPRLRAEISDGRTKR